MQPFDNLIAAHRSLRASDSVGELFARAARLAAEISGCERGLIVSVTGGHLTASGSAPLADARSDALRRALLAAPLPIVAGTLESELVRRVGRPPTAAAPSHLAESLGLEHWGMSPVVPEATTLALVVVDRSSTRLTEEEQAVLDAFTVSLALSVEHHVLRRRAADLAEEVRQFAGSTQALAQEMLDAPVALPIDHGLGPALPRAGVAGGTPDHELLALLSAQERRIADLLVQGRSNREIAESLVVSPETVKTHVARILRKLGAANRVEAAARLLRLPD